jgi:hypothetical protein
MNQETKINTDKLAPEFFVWENDHEEVWGVESNPFFVVRNGEMRIIVKSAEDESQEIIRYTDALEKFGITTDKELEEWAEKSEDLFSVANNPWFEIWSVKDQEFFSEPFFDLKEAIAYAEKMLEQYPTGIAE